VSPLPSLPWRRRRQGGASCPRHSSLRQHVPLPSQQPQLARTLVQVLLPHPQQPALHSQCQAQWMMTPTPSLESATGHSEDDWAALFMQKWDHSAVEDLRRLCCVGSLPTSLPHGHGTWRWLRTKAQVGSEIRVDLAVATCDVQWYIVSSLRLGLLPKNRATLMTSCNVIAAWALWALELYAI